MVSYCIAGASRGLGLQFVIDLLARGHVVIALARTPENSKGLQAIADKNLHVIKADVTDSASLKAAAAETAKITGGSLDVLVNNAVFVDKKHVYHTMVDFPDQDTLIKDLNASWTTNVLGPIMTIDAFLPLLRKGAVKKVLTLSTGMGDPALQMEAGYAKMTSYCISKSPLEMVNVKYALALKYEGFVFLAISPGVVDTAEEPPTREEEKEIQQLGAAFTKVYPHWTGPITATESIAMMLKVLDGAKVEDSGKFLSHLGTRQWL